jgi:uncharacterized cupredoxin-like copper-binding protein
MKRLLLLAALLPFLSAVACDDPDTTGSNDPNASPVAAEGTVSPETRPREGGAAGATVDVVLNEFSVRADTESVSPGNVDFTVKNLGDVVHEFMVVRWDGPAESLPVAGGYVQFGDAVQVVAQEAPLNGGDERDVSAAMQAGNYVLLCNQPGHYESGMRTRFAVR